MTFQEFEKVLAIFCFCFGGLALLQGHSWIAAWLLASSLLCLYCALRAPTWVLKRETRAILYAGIWTVLFIGGDIALHKLTWLSVVATGCSWSMASSWLSGRWKLADIPLSQIRKAAMAAHRAPKLEGVALTMDRIGNILFVLGVLMGLYEWLA